MAERKRSLDLIFRIFCVLTLVLLIVTAPPWVAGLSMIVLLLAIDQWYRDRP